MINKFPYENVELEFIWSAIYLHRSVASVEDIIADLEVKVCNGFGLVWWFATRPIAFIAGLLKR